MNHVLTRLPTDRRTPVVEQVVPAGPPPAPAEPEQARPRGCGLAAIAVTVVMALLLSGCLIVRQGERFAIGTERNRVNAVIFTGTSGCRRGR
ncbi:MAG: hypothetical protein JWM47_1670 [Acidimicrobiales bacterium]|nr:hypothetical protein [Acidimicrobiales bacterium]